MKKSDKEELKSIAKWQVHQPRYQQKLHSDFCAASVPDGGRMVTFHQCCRKGKIEEQGYRWCKIHAPSNVLLERKAKEKQYQEEQQKRENTYAIAAARDEVVKKAVAHFRQECSFEDLEQAVATYEKLKSGQ